MKTIFRPLRIQCLLVLALLFAGAVPGWPEQAVRVIEFSATVQRGNTFTRSVTDSLRFILRPNPTGWEIIIRENGRPKENLARLTPPFHFVPNPRYLEGWHFRNADNTGPNAVGEKNVNAPQRVRGFIFSPKVGKSIRYPQTPAQGKQLREDGYGVLEITEMELGNLVKGENAWFEWIRFKVRLELGDAFPP